MLIEGHGGEFHGARDIPPSPWEEKHPGGPLLLQPRVGGDGRAPRAPRGALRELDAEGKLRLLRGFYRGGADDLPIDVRASMRQGALVQGRRCARGAGIEADRLRVGGRWARALYLTDCVYIKDGFLRAYRREARDGAFHRRRPRAH